MCGRFTQTKSREEVIEALGGIELPPLFLRRYNIAPAQTVAAIRQQHPARAEACTWGFDGPSLVINARWETLAERPMFKDLVATGRCLIPADGFYEWKGTQPYYFHLPGHPLFFLAGLWRNGRCVVVTRAASEPVRGIHDRMPVIVPSADAAHWLVRSAIGDPPPLEARPVSRRINKVANDTPECILPAAAEEQTDLFLFPGKE